MNLKVSKSEREREEKNTHLATAKKSINDSLGQQLGGSQLKN